MKKRKELDALVANGKLGRNIRKTKKGQHELLRSETDSSEIEEFSILTPRKNNLRKAGPSRLCSAFVPVCVFILVAACGVCSGALIWMHFNLRTDLDVVREHLQKVESSNKGLPEEFHLIDTRIKDLEANHSALVTELSKLSAKVSSIIRQIGLLNQTTGSLQQSIAAAPEIKSLPNDVKVLMQDYADMGSRIAELQNTVSDLKDKQKTYDADKDHLTVNLKTLEEVNRISKFADILNATMTQQLQFISNDTHHHHLEIEELKNSTNNIQTKLKQQEGNSFTSSTVEKLKQNLEDYVHHLVGEQMNSSSVGIDPTTLLLLKNISENVKVLKQQFDKLKYEEEKNPFLGVNGSIVIQEHIKKVVENVTIEHLKNIESLKETVEYIYQVFTSQKNAQVEMKSQITAILHILDQLNTKHSSLDVENVTSSVKTEDEEDGSSDFVPARIPISLFEDDDIPTEKSFKNLMKLPNLPQFQTQHPPIFTSPLPKTRMREANHIFSDSGNSAGIIPKDLLENLEKQLSK